MLEVTEKEIKNKRGNRHLLCDVCVCVLYVCLYVFHVCELCVLCIMHICVLYVYLACVLHVVSECCTMCMSCE